MVDMVVILKLDLFWIAFVYHICLNGSVASLYSPHMFEGCFGFPNFFLPLPTFVSQSPYLPYVVKYTCKKKKKIFCFV